MSNYENISKDLTLLMTEDRLNGPYESPYRALDKNAVRRVDKEHDRPSVWRGAYVRDIDKILHSYYYNRLADKTQVFSLYNNDDITRRSLHVQLVSRISRTIGSALGLNIDLLEAISLGHDLGHTPFGHEGEKALDALLYADSGVHFDHNIQSVRVMEELFPANLTLQTLNGFAAHNGEVELPVYQPASLTGDKTTDFKAFDDKIHATELDKAENLTWIPCTLEGALMRICDIIAYLGKDRQDGMRTGAQKDKAFEESVIGLTNSEIINNLSVNIIENSYGKPYIAMDQAHFDALSIAKKNNYSYIYKSETVVNPMRDTILPLIEPTYYRLLEDAKALNTDSILYRHHIQPIESNHYRATMGKAPYGEADPNRIVADFIASMTDDYFLALYAELFPKKPAPPRLHGYFG